MPITTKRNSSKLNRCVQENVENWGQEYLRNIAGEIGEEYQVRRDKEEPAEDLLALVNQIVPYHMTHNSGMVAYLKSTEFLFETSQSLRLPLQPEHTCSKNPACCGRVWQ